MTILRISQATVREDKCDEFLQALRQLVRDFPARYDGWSVMSSPSTGRTGRLSATCRGGAAAVSAGATLTYYDGNRSRAATDRLNPLIDAGSFEVHLARTFPWRRARDAHLALRDQYIGRMALRVS
jgi:NADPH:quinone reductase-like Zn-dependent oxidoreductase